MDIKYVKKSAFSKNSKDKPGTPLSLNLSEYFYKLVADRITLLLVPPQKDFHTKLEI